MLIQQNHAILLLRLLAEEANTAASRPTRAETEREACLELELQGLARLEGPLLYGLTHSGRQLAQALVRAVELGLCPHPERWEADWRWLGSEIITMLAGARRAGRVGPLAMEPLHLRGLAELRRSPETGKTVPRTSEVGDRVWEVHTAAQRALSVDAELAARLRELPLGPASPSSFALEAHDLRRLEAMGLLAYSVPNSEVAILTGLGRAVRETLKRAGFGAEGVVLDLAMLRALAAIADEERQEISADATATLQALGYLDAEARPTEGGEWALESYRLWQRTNDPGEIWTLHLPEDALLLLRTIDELLTARATNPDLVPDEATLRHHMIERQKRRYREILERWPDLEEMPARLREIAKAYREARSLESWYDRHFSLKSDLYLLESFGLAESTALAQREAFVVTGHGRELLEVVPADRGDIPSSAVKAVVYHRKPYAAPALSWVEMARQAGLAGPFEPSRLGQFLGELAERVVRRPHLTDPEVEVLRSVGSGESVEAVQQARSSSMSTARVEWALAMLEARHLVEVLPDGNVVPTEAGRRMQEAVAAVTPGLANPVHPVLYRAVKAVAEVGTLYEKERKVRIPPRHLHEAEKRSGLAPDAFAQALHLARRAGFVGHNSVTHAGLLLLEAAEGMNPRARDLRSYRSEPLQAAGSRP